MRFGACSFQKSRWRRSTTGTDENSAVSDKASSSTVGPSTSTQTVCDSLVMCMPTFVSSVVPLLCLGEFLACSVARIRSVVCFACGNSLPPMRHLNDGSFKSSTLL